LSAKHKFERRNGFERNSSGMSGRLEEGRLLKILIPKNILLTAKAVV